MRLAAAGSGWRRPSAPMASLLALVCLIAGPRWGATQQRRAPERWSLSSELRVGDDESGEAYEFTNIVGVALSPEALVHVMQQREQGVRVFDARGRHVRTIGRDGGGPGEFRGLAAIGFLGDTLWSYDSSLRRLSYFAADGTFLTSEATTPMPARRSRDDVVFFTWIAILLRDGTAIGSGSTSADAAVRGAVRTTPWFRMSRAGAVRDTIVAVRLRPPIGLQRGEGASLSRTFFAQPFSDEPLVAVSASGRLFIVERDVASSVTGARFTVRALTVDGDTLWTRHVPYVPKRLTARMVDSVVNGIAESFQRSRIPYTAAQIRAPMFVPDFLPPITGVTAAQDGTLWVRGEHVGAAVDYTVISADGAVLANLSIPRAVRPLWISGDVVWAAETDADDVPLLVKYRLRKPAAR